MIMHIIGSQEDEIRFSREVWEKEAVEVGETMTVNDEEREVLGVRKHRDYVTVRLQVPALTITPDEIEAMRKSMGMSQIQFAEAMGVIPRTVRTWISGKVVPSHSARAMMRILKFFHEKDLLGAWIRRITGAGSNQVTSAEKIRSVRMAYGMTQRTFAIEMGIPQVTLIQWENSKRTPRNVASALLTAFLFLQEMDLAEEWLANN